MSSITREKVYIGIICILLLISYFINLGKVPLWLEEPRRALIALEMLYNDNLWVPTEMGEYYYKKPPLWNWVLIGAYKLFGGPTEFATRFFSVLSFITMGMLVYWMGQQYVNKRFGLQSALLFLVSSDIYFYFSLLGEIDIFYSLLTLISFFAIYHFGAQQRWLLLFGVTYLFGALGVLTKGLPSVPFLGISLLTYFIFIRAFRRLFYWQHMVGLGIFLLVVGGYLYMYDQYNPAINYMNPEESVYTQTSERTVFSQGIAPLLKHLVIFPLDTLKNIMPATLLLLFIIRKDWIKVLRSNHFVTFCALLFITNISIYWISPGTTARYVYMMYPLLIIVFLYGFHYYAANNGDAGWRTTVYRGAVWVVLGLFLLAALALPFIEVVRTQVDRVVLISVFAALAVAGLMWLYFKKPAWGVYHLIAAFVVARLVVNMVVVPVRLDGPLKLPAVELKEAGIHMAAINNGLPVCAWQDDYVPHTLVFYYERAEGKVLERAYELKPQHYYIVRKGKELPGAEKVYSFSKGKENYVLLLKK